MNVNLHIERLILDGLSIESKDRSRIQAAVETELGRLLKQDHTASLNLQSGAVPSVRADTIQLHSGGDAVRLGRQIAASIYGSIGRRV